MTLGKMICIYNGYVSLRVFLFVCVCVCVCVYTCCSIIWIIKSKVTGHIVFYLVFFWGMLIHKVKVRTLVKRQKRAD